MTTTPLKSSPRKVELAPNQIYLLHANQQDHPIHTAIEGYPDWSIYKWGLINRIGLFYKGHLATTLHGSGPGPFIDDRYNHPETSSWSSWTRPAPPSYSTLIEAIEYYCTMPERLALIDTWNAEDGLETWCLRQSFTPVRLPLDVTVPLQELKRMERLADYEGSTLHELALEALYKHFGDIEKRYLEYQAWKQRQATSSTEHKTEEVRTEVQG
jgi:hypothetical protein